MSYYCAPCERWFNTVQSLDQHVASSSAHRYESSSEEGYESSEEDMSWECEWAPCGRSFGSQRACEQHMANASGHPYCSECQRMFANEHNLTQHLHSRRHMGSTMKCPFCSNGFTTASAVTIHLESGACTSGMTRQTINETVQRLDRNHVITRPQLTLPGYDPDIGETIATDAAWNGSCYACYFCPRGFDSLRALNQHLRSPAHVQKIYKCPNPGCGANFNLLSGLVQHVESERCGLLRFDQVQHHAKTGIENMVGRMIQY